MPEPFDQSLPVSRGVYLIADHCLTDEFPVYSYCVKNLVSVRVEQGALNAANRV